MNHYERLKVNRDAPIEVIRAAYRALAAKHHPDRHTQSEASHGDMAALNMAYEVLADPAARSAYDEELAGEQTPQDTPEEQVSRLHQLWRSTMGFGQTEPSPPDEPPESRVDVHWRSPMPAADQNPWLSRKRLVPVAGALGVLVALACIWWVRQAFVQMEAEQTLSQHYGDKLHAASATARPGMRAAVPARSVADMTDEELLADIPAVSGRARAGTESHLLDGSPLPLRQETQLMDPLALPPHP